jgi:hypothetical protein
MNRVGTSDSILEQVTSTNTLSTITDEGKFSLDDWSTLDNIVAGQHYVVPLPGFMGGGTLDQLQIKRQLVVESDLFNDEERKMALNRLDSEIAQVNKSSKPVVRKSSPPKAVYATIKIRIRTQPKINIIRMKKSMTGHVFEDGGLVGFKLKPVDTSKPYTQVHFQFRCRYTAKFNTLQEKQFRTKYVSGHVNVPKEASNKEIMDRLTNAVAKRDHKHCRTIFITDSATVVGIADVTVTSILKATVGKVYDLRAIKNKGEDIVYKMRGSSEISANLGHACVFEVLSQYDTMENLEEYFECKRTDGVSVDEIARYCKSKKIQCHVVDLFGRFSGQILFLNFDIGA